MRDPSIHIRRSDLTALMSELGVDINVIPYLMSAASKISIKNRVFVTTKAKGKRKSDRAAGADSASLDRFNAIYMGVMISNNIKVIPITKISPQHLTLKEVCWQSLEFCKLFQLGEEQGFKLYIELGLKLLGNKFGIYRLKSSAQRITEYYNDKILIETDKDPEGTDDIITAWVQAVKVYFKTSIELENDAQRAHFIHAREDADSLKADYYDFISAQFEKYSYLNSIPSFSQFYGDQAKINYQLYRAKVKKEHNTNEEQQYFKQVANEKTIETKATQQEKSIREARLSQSLSRAGCSDD
jgi:hypothetical protein